MVSAENKKELNLKLSISTFFICLTLFSSCSSLKQEKAINDGLTKDALTYYYAAEDYRLNGKLNEALNLYDRASSHHLNKLSYREFALTKLKKALVFVSLNKLKEAQNIITQAHFWKKKFELDIDKEMKGVEAKVLLAKGEKKEALKLLLELTEIYSDDLLLKTYYQAITLETDITQEEILLPQVKQSFESLYSKYQDKGTNNPDALIYIGKSILKTQKELNIPFIRKMEILSRELEIPSLSLFLLEHYRDKSTKEEKAFFKYLIKEFDKKEKGAILI